MTDQIITDNPSTLRHIEELYRQGVIDQAKYLELRKETLRQPRGASRAARERLPPAQDRCRELHETAKPADTKEKQNYHKERT